MDGMNLIRLTYRSYTINRSSKIKIKIKLKEKHHKIKTKQIAQKQSFDKQARVRNPRCGNLAATKGYINQSVEEKKQIPQLER